MDELTGLAATLDALLGRLSATLRHEKRFSAEIAHELRTPLSQLRAETELALARDRSPGELREALEGVMRYTERMTSVVNTLMAAAERESDSQSGTVDAGEAASAAVASCADSAGERGIDLATSSPHERIEVDADADMTVQLLTPLISNAIRYGRSRVRVTVARDGEAVAFRVTDDGPGLGPVSSSRCSSRVSAGRPETAVAARASGWRWPAGWRARRAETWWQSPLRRARSSSPACPPADQTFRRPSCARADDLGVKRPSLATVLIWTFALLLTATVINRAVSISAAVGRFGPDRVTFQRIAKPLPGSFGPVMVGYKRAVDVACAQHHPRSYKLCVTIDAGHVLSVHKSPG